MQRRNSIELSVGLILCIIGTVLMFQYCYYDDFIKAKTMSLEDLIFYNSEYHFSFEKSLCFLFYAFSSALLLNSFGFWNITKYINKKSIKEKIKEGKKELIVYMKTINS